MVAGVQNGGLNVQPDYCVTTGSASVGGSTTGTLYNMNVRMLGGIASLYQLHEHTGRKKRICRDLNLKFRSLESPVLLGKKTAAVSSH